MAETTEFSHDQLGHLLADHLLEVPQFQRSYAWDQGNVEEYLADLEAARKKTVSYFMGTVVFASPDTKGGRRQIVDGQQRLATTAILLLAIRDLLTSYDKRQQAEKVDERYLRGYVLSAEEVVERLVLSPKDQEDYDALLDDRSAELEGESPLRQCYVACIDYLTKLAPTAKQYGLLLEISEQLENQVQVLVAVASDLPEAYVIFETLNDRGADLTTADLLKNYLFSQAKDHFQYVHNKWIALETNFEKAEDLVKFIRYEYVSRHGPVSTRKLYRAIQDDLRNAGSAKKYVERLSKAQEIYTAIKDPDDSFWSGLHVETRDALLAYRRFGFESSIPVLIAAFQNWKKPVAAKLLVKLAKWSVRAQFAGRIGASLSEEAFGNAAAGISSGQAHNQTAVRELLTKLIPTDPEFKAAFISYGPVSVARAKYVLAMLEKGDDVAHGRPERALDWSSKAVTIEHILSKASASDDDELAGLNQIGNLALLEKKLNRELGSKPFATKQHVYKTSEFVLTRAIDANDDCWDLNAIELRTADLAERACKAWPAA